jgi:hypothetical protein
MQLGPGTGRRPTSSQDEEALGHLIISIARGKAKHGIRHWGVSQASLEDAYVTWR